MLDKAAKTAKPLCVGSIPTAPPKFKVTVADLAVSLVLANVSRTVEEKKTPGTA